LSDSDAADPHTLASQRRIGASAPLNDTAKFSAGENRGAPAPLRACQFA
jgi:hypothetical protein